MSRVRSLFESGRVALVALVLIAPSVLVAASPRPERAGRTSGPASPNVVIVVVDDMPASQLGLAGDPLIRTPTIDRLAARGAYLRNHYVVTGLCSPSRAALLTGRTPHTTGVVRNGIVLPPEEVTLGDVLGDHGYVTGVVGKGHLGRRLAYDPDYLGFDFQLLLYPDEGFILDWNDYDLSRNGVVEHHTEYITDYLTDEAIAFVRDAVGSRKPFFLWLGHAAVHAPINPPETDLYEIDDVPWPPASIGDGLLDKPPQQRDSIYHQRFFGQGQALILRNKERSYEAVSNVDANLDRLLTALYELRVLHNTLVVFVSDHGYFFGEHQLVGKGQFFYEEQMRSPVVIAGPGVLRRGLVSDTLVSSIDLMPTVLDLLDLPIPDQVEGRSFEPILTGRSSEHRSSIWMEYFSLFGWVMLPDDRERHLNPMRGVVFKHRGRQYKWTRYLPSAEGVGDGLDYELYDLDADPHELVNVMRREGPQHNALLDLQADPEWGDVVLRARKEAARWMTETNHARRVHMTYGGSEGAAVTSSADGTAVLAWNAVPPASAVVEYESYGSEVREIVDLREATEHRVVLTGLEPGTTYEVRVYSLAGEGSGGYFDAVFTTP